MTKMTNTQISGAKLTIMNMFDNAEDCKVIMKVEEYDGSWIIEGDAWDADGEYLTDFELEHSFDNWRDASMSCNILANKLVSEGLEAEYARGR